MGEMTVTERDAFLRQTRIAKLVTLYADGHPSVVPVWYEWDGQVATLFTSRDSEKVRRIRRDPRVALTVEEGVGVPEAWVTIEGAASIQDTGGLELARTLIDRYYAPEHAAQVWPSWEAAGGQWVVVTVTPTRIRSSAPEG
ncbi:MAG: TIGR03618 family F420-dependent PPOX class oxidoreductase [Tepidiformaceae bacterium]